MTTAYAIKCRGCARRWVGLFSEDRAPTFGIECPGCGQSHGVAITPPAYFDSEEEAQAYFKKPDAEVVAMVRP